MIWELFYSFGGILTYVNLFLICYHIPNYSAMGKLGVKIQNTKFKEQKIKMRLKQLKMSKLKNWIPL